MINEVYNLFTNFNITQVMTNNSILHFNDIILGGKGTVAQPNLTTYSYVCS